MSKLDNTTMVIYILLVCAMIFGILSPWYRLLRMHVDGWDKHNDDQHNKYTFARTLAIGEVVFVILFMICYWFNRITLPWYIIERADPFEVLCCLIMTTVGIIVITTAIRSKNIKTGERWFVVTAVLCILMLAWCETLIPWAH